MFSVLYLSNSAVTAADVDYCEATLVINVQILKLLVTIKSLVAP